MKKYNFNLKNRVVLITGASRGIGYELAKCFLSVDANVIICSSKLQNLKKSYKKLKKLVKKKQKLIYKKTDISSEKEIDSLVKFSINNFGHIDVLINNAGIYGPIGTIDKVNWNEWKKTIKVNLFGSIYLCKKILPYFKKKKYGKIIQLSGGGAASPLPNVNAYAVSKVGIVRFVENLAQEVKKFNIDVNAVAPGAINTDMLDELLKAGKKKIGNYYYQKALMQKKMGGSSYEHVNKLILFLASSYSNGISGRLISAIWDDWKILPKYKKKLLSSDIFTLRRITPKDRGFKWGLSSNNSIYDKSLIPNIKK